MRRRDLRRLAESTDDRIEIDAGELMKLAKKSAAKVWRTFVAAHQGRVGKMKIAAASLRQLLEETDRKTE